MAALAALRARGVAFAPQVTEGDFTRLAFFTDPDGTPLYLAPPRLGAAPR